MDALTAASQSLTARREAASHLPTFELPPPPQLPQFSSSAQKPSNLSGMSGNQSPPAQLSLGHLLTPPSNASGENLNPSSSAATSSNAAAHSGLPSYAPPGYSWPSTGTTPYGFGTSTPQEWANPPYQPKGMFSPSISSVIRNNAGSPTSREGLPGPQYDTNHIPSYANTSMPMSAPPTVTVPPVGMPPQQHQHQHQHHQQHPHPHSHSHQQHHQQPIANPMMSVQSIQNVVTSGPTQSSPVTAEQYAHKPPTPTVYGGPQPPSAPPNHAPYPPYNHVPSPVQQSPMSASAPQSRISPLSGPSPVGPNSTQNQFGRPYPSYSLPAMSGPIMSNVHSPGNQLSLVGSVPSGIVPGFNSGHAAGMQHVYGGHPHPQQAQQTDRPFKCDQCPQSFNRNHDLKRHTRIHLAVKPFPCQHCDKSFSRKDALKRHVLVKGCGKAIAESVVKDETLSQKEGSASDGTEESPIVNGHG